MNIILIGFMGCGKSTLGVRLSYRMKQPYLDTDKYIERIEDRSISDIFAQDGEEYFRKTETRVLEEFLDKKLKNHVISTGGGMPVRKANRELLSKIGVVVWLRVKPETVVERLKGDTTRPLLQTDNPTARISELMEARADAYEACSDIIVDVDDKPIERIMDEIFTKSRGVWKKKKKIIVR